MILQIATDLNITENTMAIYVNKIRTNTLNDDKIRLTIFHISYSSIEL